MTSRDQVSASRRAHAQRPGANASHQARAPGELFTFIDFAVYQDARTMSGRGRFLRLAVWKGPGVGLEFGCPVAPRLAS